VRMQRLVAHLLRESFPCTPQLAFLVAARGVQITRREKMGKL